MKRRIGVASLINELLFGGDENRLLSFSRTVNAGRFDHQVVCVKQPSREFDSRNGTMREQYLAAGIRVADLGEGYPNLGASRAMMPVNRGAMLARSVARFCRHIREHRIDVVDAHLGSGSLVGAMAASLMRIPVTITTYPSSNGSRSGSGAACIPSSCALPPRSSPTPSDAPSR